VRQLELEPRSVPFLLKPNVETVAEQAFVAEESVDGFAQRAGYSNLVTDDAERPDADLLSEKEPKSRLPRPVQRGFDELLVGRHVDRTSLVAVEPMSV